MNAEPELRFKGKRYMEKVLEIHMYVFWPYPWEIVKMSQDKFRIFDLSRISAFIKYIVNWGFLVHRPRYWSIFT